MEEWWSDVCATYPLMRHRIVWVQVGLVAGAFALGAYLFSNVLSNLSARNISSGFSFLRREAGFEIGETPFIFYSASDSYLRALCVGLANTLKVACIGITLSTFLGLAVGLSRLSGNLLLRGIAAGYVTLFRNTPLLVQLFFWYALFTEALPVPSEAWIPLKGLFLSNRGVFFAIPGSSPVMDGFNISGGAHLSPEFAALVFGLIIYTSSYIGEVIRSGILALPKGQIDAAYAMGLTPGKTMWHIVLPQALRTIIPPLTSQYLNLTKNSTLAVAIGFPDFVSVINTTINQTGQAIEGVALIMAVYLALSLAISSLMNWYNASRQ